MDVWIRVYLRQLDAIFRVKETRTYFIDSHLPESYFIINDH